MKSRSRSLPLLPALVLLGFKETAGFLPTIKHAQSWRYSGDITKAGEFTRTFRSITIHKIDPMLLTVLYLMGCLKVCIWHLMKWNGTAEMARMI
jgi:hypothetical protein